MATSGDERAGAYHHKVNRFFQPHPNVGNAQSYLFAVVVVKELMPLLALVTLYSLKVSV